MNEYLETEEFESAIRNGTMPKGCLGLTFFMYEAGELGNPASLNAEGGGIQGTTLTMIFVFKGTNHDSS